MLSETAKHIAQLNQGHHGVGDAMRAAGHNADMTIDAPILGADGLSVCAAELFG